MPKLLPVMIIFGAKKVIFLDFLKVDLELFRGCLGIIFDLKNPIFSKILSLRGRYVTSKIKFYVKCWLLERIILAIFRLKKPVFRAFWKLFRSCLEVVWEIFSAYKSSFLCVISARKMHRWPPKSKCRVTLWSSQRAILTIFIWTKTEGVMQRSGRQQVPKARLGAGSANERRRCEFMLYFFLLWGH